jgi:hypothetical protein
MIVPAMLRRHQGSQVGDLRQTDPSQGGPNKAAPGCKTGEARRLAWD